MRSLFYNRKRITFFSLAVFALFLIYTKYQNNSSIDHRQKQDSWPEGFHEVNPLDGKNTRNVNANQNRSKPIESLNKVENNQQAEPNTKTNPIDKYGSAFPRMVIPVLSNSESTGPGEGGKGFVVVEKDLNPEQLAEYKKGMNDNAFNQFASDRISVRRFIEDKRPQECKDMGANVTLPKTSVIICFHNEAWSALIRSVHSIIDRTNPNLLEEIILVDDASNMDHLKNPLEVYVQKLQIVKIVRLAERQGLIRARLQGASVAKAKILTFLDSHIECLPGWIEPLLKPISENYRNVVAPVIVSIQDDNLAVSYMKPEDVQVGGFTWSLVYTWHFPPKKDRERPGAPYSPISTPTIAGGLFSIDRDFFKELGYYDPGFEVWGAENLEISFKTWMCHGNLYIAPCSQVGHIFRKRSPYSWHSKFSNPLKRNNDRLAEVWLDDYKKFYYERSGARLPDIGDIQPRIDLRKANKCNTFDWYLKNIYPDIFNPGEAILHGRIRNPELNVCIDAGSRKAKSLVPYPCHNNGGNQMKKGYRYHAWYLTKLGEIRQEEKCFDVNVKPGYLSIYPCHGMKGFQYFKYTESKTGSVIESNRGCVQAETNELLIKPCKPEEPKQQWIWESIFY